ncbi:MAG: TonB-dependent receptor [Campylobacterales bacterium]|nr:TonB-dependent receptor [Campylobacterales bacterium]
MNTRFSVALLLTPLSLLAAQPDSTLLDTLVNEIDTITHIAKDQRANIDYLPYIMTVFEGEELSRAGASSLKEALALAAGVNLSSDTLALSNPVFRGSNPTAFGQSKLIVDGTEVNDLFFDGYTAYLSMPIDMIKRIEIVRGPGSYSDGHWGYAGSIVVTTYKKEPSAEGSGRWFVSLGSDVTRKAGVSYATSHEDFSFAADLYTVHDNLSLLYGPDGLSNNLFGSINAPLSRSGHAPSSTDATMASVSLSKGAFFAEGRLSSYRHGSEGGINYALASEGDHYNIDQWSLRGGARYRVGEFAGKIEIAVQQDTFKSDSLLAPAGFTYPIPYPDGFYGSHEAVVQTYQLQNTLSGTVAGGETSFGVRASWSRVASEKTITTDRNTGMGLTDYSVTYPFFDPDASINDLVAYATYERAITPSLSGYASLTLERRSNLSTWIDPRVAAVYSLNPDNQIKGSISRAHRNPSWQEMFTLNNRARWGNPDLEPESVLAYEIQYIRRFAADHTLSVNLFRLNNDDQIYLQYNPSISSFGYVNGSKSRITGIEAEWRKRYDTTSFYAAYTHIRAEDGNGDTLAFAPSDTLHGFITHEISERCYGSLAGRWQSTTPREPGDPREDMKAFGVVDASLGYKLPSLPAEIQLSVKNVFDEHELYASPAGTYDDDFPSAGRAFLATIRGSF